MDSDINPLLLSSFVGALSLFGSESLGKIEEITIKGLSIQMIIVNKFDLVLIAIMDKDFVKEDMREEAEKALEMFYHLYKNEISDCADVSQFESFKNILFDQIVEYFNRVNGENTKTEIRDFGFFTEAIAKSRN